METIAKIRRLHLADRLSIRSITRKTGLSRNTIRKYLRSNGVQPRYRLNSSRPSRCLIEHEVRLQDLYAADALRSGREQMTMQGFYDILVQEGFEGSYDTVRRYILRLREKTRSGRNRGYIPLAFNAGDVLQFDWSCEDVVLDGVECRVSVAHFRLCHSRKPFVIAYPRESQEMVLDAFNEAFDFYGGVPRRVIIDNPKTMVTHIGKGKDRTFHSRFLALMSHYALEPVACTPASGWEKGQVENQVKSLRKQIFSPKLSFDTRDDLNTFLRARCETLANKPHPEDKTRKICDVFEDERAYLRPVGQPFDGYSEKSVRVSQTCLVQHSTNSYSVPCSYAGEMVSLRAYADRIVISDTHDVIAEHPRSFGRYGKHFCIWHYLPLFQQRPGALRDGAPFKQWKAPQSLSFIWKHYQKQPGGDRDFVELLTLTQQHGQEAVEMACELALSHGTIQLNAIIALLHDLTGEAITKEMAIEAVSYPHIQLPPEANCYQYDQLMSFEYPKDFRRSAEGESI